MKTRKIDLDKEISINSIINQEPIGLYKIIEPTVVTPIVPYEIDELMTVLGENGEWSKWLKEQREKRKIYVWTISVWTQSMLESMLKWPRDEVALMLPTRNMEQKLYKHVGGCRKIIDPYYFRFYTKYMLRFLQYIDVVNKATGYYSCVNPVLYDLVWSIRDVSGIIESAIIGGEFMSCLQMNELRISLEWLRSDIVSKSGQNISQSFDYNSTLRVVNILLYGITNENKVNYTPVEQEYLSKLSKKHLYGLRQ